jgi:uncharacterized protein with PIN domain
MKAYIETAGDQYVGINGEFITIDGLTINDDKDRQITRKFLADAFGGFFDEKAGVRFEDECPDCGTKMVFSSSFEKKNGIDGLDEEFYDDVLACPNPHCISNLFIS